AVRHPAPGVGEGVRHRGCAGDAPLRLREGRPHPHVSHRRRRERRLPPRAREDRPDRRGIRPPRRPRTGPLRDPNGASPNGSAAYTEL
ncbi:MAG: hypothetical protein AVDCRST_MAG55-501, partial [uncultured Rubrobacteraceae bacterium]